MYDSAATTNAVAQRDGSGDIAFRRVATAATSGGLDNLGYERGGVTTESATFTINNQDVNGVMFYVTTAASNRTANLPAAASWAGQVIEIVKVDSGAGTVIVDPNGSETIGAFGAPTTFTLSLQGDAIRVRSDGVGWQVLNVYFPLDRKTIGVTTAAAGSSLSDAGALPAATANAYPTTGADGTKGVKIHVNDKIDGRTIFIGNGVSNAILKVYGPSGATINGASADVAYSSASGKSVVIVCLSASGNTWLASG